LVYRIFIGHDRDVPSTSGTYTKALSPLFLRVIEEVRSRFVRPIKKSADLHQDSADIAVVSDAGRAFLERSVARLVVEKAYCDIEAVIHATKKKSVGSFTLVHQIQEVYRHSPCLPKCVSTSDLDFSKTFISVITRLHQTAFRAFERLELGAPFTLVDIGTTFLLISFPPSQKKMGPRLNI
jgi:hypothetical protein